MIETPYKNVVFSMLSATGEPVADTTSHRLDAGGWVDYPIPPEVGKGGYECDPCGFGGHRFGRRGN
jgi:hypothetical protein